MMLNSEPPVDRGLHVAFHRGVNGAYNICNALAMLAIEQVNGGQGQLHSRKWLPGDASVEGEVGVYR